MHHSRLAGLLFLGLLGCNASAQQPREPARPDEPAASNEAPRKDPNAPVRKEVSRRPTPRVKAETTKTKHSWAVRGFGANYEDAYEQAVRQAHDAVSGFLLERGLTWQPSVEDVRQMIVSKKDEKLTEDDELTAITANNKVVLQVECTEKDYRGFLKKDRMVRADKRVFGIGKWLAAVLIGLTFLGSYLRVEEATKGYFTMWLRLGMLGMIAAAVAGLFYGW